MSPPMPVEVGSVTLSAAATATAASAALPPRARISRPAATASGWEAATIPPRPITGELRDTKLGSCISPPGTKRSLGAERMGRQWSAAGMPACLSPGPCARQPLPRGGQAGVRRCPPAVLLLLRVAGCRGGQRGHQHLVDTAPVHVHDLEAQAIPVEVVRRLRHPPE